MGVGRLGAWLGSEHSRARLGAYGGFMPFHGSCRDGAFQGRAVTGLQPQKTTKLAWPKHPPQRKRPGSEASAAATRGGGAGEGLCGWRALPSEWAHLVMTECAEQRKFPKRTDVLFQMT